MCGGRMQLIRRRILAGRLRCVLSLVSMASVVIGLLVVMKTTFDLHYRTKSHSRGAVGFSNYSAQGGGKRRHYVQNLVQPPSTSKITSTSTAASTTHGLPDGAMLPCNWTTDNLLRPSRARVRLSCSRSSSRTPSSQTFFSSSSIILETVSSGGAEPSVTSLNDTSCLRRVIEDHCGGEQSLRVPKVVHYVQFGRSDMSLEHFLSVASAAKFVRPCLVLIHGDALPAGPYWRAALGLVHNIVHVRLQRPAAIYGRQIRRPEHSSDVARLRILRDFGGIYLDNDQLVLQPLGDLLDEQMVISKEAAGKCGNGFLVARRGATFLSLWLRNYTDFNDRSWATHSTHRPFMLAKDFPALVKVIDGFFKPNFQQVRRFFRRRAVPRFDWSARRGFHFYHNRVKDLMRAVRVDRQDNVIGDAVRRILYGDENGCMPPPR